MMKPIKLAPVIDSVIDARYLMIKRLPRNILNNFISRSNLNNP